MLRLAIAVIGLAIGPAVVGAGASIDAFVEAEMEAAAVPGMAYAVVSEGEIVEVGALGVVEVGGENQVALDTPFPVGSVTKSFTALAVMQLVEAGEVELEAGISQYLDEFESPASEITVRQLLGHTSGYSTFQGNESRTDATGASDELATTVDAIAAVEPAYEPGLRWEYSNTNYQILGRLIEVVSGQDYQTYIATNILEPLGMANSFVADGDAHDSMATGHQPFFGTRRPINDKTTHRGTAPQGGLIATAGDLGLYLQMMMNGEDDILSADGKATMMSPASELYPYYGFGWYLDPERGSAWHTGLSPGFESSATMIPSQQSAVVVLINANGGLGLGETAGFINGVTEIGLGFDYEGEGSAWPRTILFLSLVVAPVVYLVSIFWAWRHRDEIRAKSGASGAFSIWFPLLTTLGAAFVLLWLVPRLFGTPLGNLSQFQPDLVIVLVVTALLGVVWALFRLGVAYSRKTTDV